MKSLNRATLLGHLGKDAETKFTPGGVSVTKFSIATSRSWKDQASGEWKEATDWHDCVYWKAEAVANYLTKGKQVYVEGRLSTHCWDDKHGVKHYSTEIVVDHLILCGSAGAKPPEDKSNGQAAAQNEPTPVTPITEKAEIPF